MTDTTTAGTVFKQRVFLRKTLGKYIILPRLQEIGVETNSRNIYFAGALQINAPEEHDSIRITALHVAFELRVRRLAADDLASFRVLVVHDALSLGGGISYGEIFEMPKYDQEYGVGEVFAPIAEDKENRFTVLRDMRDSILSSEGGDASHFVDIHIKTNLWIHQTKETVLSGAIWLIVANGSNH